MSVLVVAGDFGEFLSAHHVDTVGPVETGRVKVGVVEQGTMEGIREDNIGVKVKPPAEVLEVAEAGIDPRPFFELPAVLTEQVGLHTADGVLTADGVRFLVVVGSYHGERINV